MNKDQEENGYAYIKKQCMHCVDPNCVSVCPVSALKKIRKPASSTMTKMSAPAAVTVWLPARTTYLSTTTTTRLARFTSVSCVTRKALSVWIKAVCPVCGSFCPAGAVIFGTREELMAEAKNVWPSNQGSEYHYPRQTLKTDDTYLHTVPKYYPHLYGEKEGGGTQVLVLTGVPYEDLDLPKLDDLSTGARSSMFNTRFIKA